MPWLCSAFIPKAAVLSALVVRGHPSFFMWNFASGCRGTAIGSQHCFGRNNRGWQLMQAGSCCPQRLSRWRQGSLAFWVGSRGAGFGVMLRERVL